VPRLRRQRTAVFLSPRDLRALVRRALAEDRVESDLTTRLLLERPVRAVGVVEAQATGVLAGVTVAEEIARAMGLRVHRLRKDGDRMRKGTRVLELNGDARRILTAERTLLNFLMHLSGVATATAQAVRAAGNPRHGPSVRVYATRKTLPGLRDLEKAAVIAGGGWPHRRDLASGILIKNNHLALVPLRTAVTRAVHASRRSRRVQVEVRSADEAVAAAQLGAHALLLDNVSPTVARQTLRRLAAEVPGPRPFVEISGGITPANVARYRATGADAVSLGFLTHSAPALPYHLILRRRRARVPPA
jgi:nicotinate-nucleotide pyrophosphorylase (carboxylating)